ncbi:MAG: C40 family peptidase [Clostridia bacterium]|nr:C40 family peptidase [Clostridia bacterium]
MKKNIIHRIFPFVLLIFIITGCGGESKNGIPAQKQMDEKNTIYLGDGVVNETVVDVYKNMDIQSERLTQAVFNQPVTILESKGQWTKVKVFDGCEGWIKSKYIDSDCSSLNPEGARYKIVVTNKKLKVTSGRSGGLTLIEVVLGTEFYAKGISEEAYEVSLPGNQTGWVSKNGTIQMPVDASIPKTAAIDFVTTADKFKGTTYLLGGVSSYGIDCSGLTYICAKINGIQLPRLTGQQFKSGKTISNNLVEVKSGDLLFFSTNEDRKDVSHVGIYVGDENFIHASKAKGRVQLGSLKDRYYERRLVGIKRIF